MLKHNRYCFGGSSLATTSPVRSMRRSVIDACRTSHPDLAVLDVMMPGLTGLEAVLEIRNNPALKDIPVILLTARAQQSDVQTGYDSGADDPAANRAPLLALGLGWRRGVGGCRDRGRAHGAHRIGRTRLGASR